MKRYAAPIGWALGMLVLILDGKTAMAGGAEGISICVKTLIPSLFPFFFLSAMLTGSMPGSLLLTGILGGYPVGAGNAAAAYRTGRINRRDAQRMVVLCNCAGPSFIFGVIVPIFGDIRLGFGVWGAYLLSIFALWIIFPKSAPVSSTPVPVKPQQALWNSLRAMAGVCGWVILFRVMLSILDRWVLWLFPEWVRIGLYGILELSNGCLALRNLETSLAAVLASGFIAFGGLCVFLQTASVTGGISLKYYFPGKLFQSAVSMLASSFLFPGAISPLVQVFLFLAAMLLGLWLRKIEKRCGKIQRIIV